MLNIFETLFQDICYQGIDYQDIFVELILMTKFVY